MSIFSILLMFCVVVFWLTVIAIHLSKIEILLKRLLR